MAKHIPMRSCIACRESKPKRELIRVVRVSDDLVQIDKTGRQNGRGAYFCPAVECWELGQKKRALNHALTMSVPPDNWEALLAFAREKLPEHKVQTRVTAQAAAGGAKKTK